MNKNSMICNFILENPNDWREKLKALNVRVKDSSGSPLAIFNYELGADFTNPLVREARGIVIRLDSVEPVCWAFNKFCNYGEEGAKIDLDGFDWDRCSCQEKIDGSIVKLYFDPFANEWRWATNSCMNANEATLSSEPGTTFLDVIRSAVNYGRIPFDSLDRDLTYVFELVSPRTQVVVKYPETRLYHTGTRNLVSGLELDVDLGIAKPKEYPLRSLEDCVRAVEEMNRDSDEVTQEGFVVVDPSRKRVKVKSPGYFAMHHLANNGFIAKENLVELLRDGNVDPETLVRDFPLHAVMVRYYAYRMAELEWNVDRFVGYARGLYEEYDHDRKAFALQIKDSKYAAFGFAAIGNEKTAAELLGELRLNRYCKLIPDYVPERVY